MIKMRVIFFLLLVIFMIVSLVNLATVSFSNAGQSMSRATIDDRDIESGDKWPNPRFKDNGDGTMTDNLTGLMWLKHANCWGERTWKNALDTIADFNRNPRASHHNCQEYTATYNDWHIPSVEELQSLVNKSESNLANWLKSMGFIDVQPLYYWSSNSDGKDNALLINIQNGKRSSRNKDAGYCVWAVRAAK